MCSLRGALSTDGVSEDDVGAAALVLWARRGCAGAVDGSRGGGGASTNKKTPRGTGGLRVSGWADALLDNEGGAVHPGIVAHVTEDGQAFHHPDRMSTAQRRRFVPDRTGSSCRR